MGKVYAPFMHKIGMSLTHKLLDKKLVPPPFSTSARAYSTCL